jgi:hypothetical protein
LEECALDTTFGDVAGGNRRSAHLDIHMQVWSGVRCTWALNKVLEETGRLTDPVDKSSSRSHYVCFPFHGHFSLYSDSARDCLLEYWLMSDAGSMAILWDGDCSDLLTCRPKRAFKGLEMTDWDFGA